MAGWCKAVSICLAAGVTVSVAKAQDVTALAEALAAEPAIPGATVGWVDADRMVWAVAGLRVAGGDDPVERTDPWHIGSLTKSMTATLAARLVAEGTISWDTALAGDGPSLLALLTHRGGFPANPGPVRLALMNRDWQAPQGQTRTDLIAATQPQGTAFLYSNLGYIAAGQMLANAGQAEWEALMRDALFAPLGLGSAGFGPPGRETGSAPWGHSLGRSVDPTRAVADNPPAFGPAGSVHLSTPDMLRYLRAHLVRDPEFLPAVQWDRLHTPPEGADYALGWVLRPDGTLWHNGSNTLWYAEAIVDPVRGRAAFVAVNSGDLAAVQGPVERALAALMAP